MPIILLILFCIVGVGFTLVLFCGWLIFTIFRLVAGAIESMFLTRPRRAMITQDSSTGWSCERRMCRTANPTHARFCRRCGRAVVVEPVKVRMALANV